MLDSDHKPVSALFEVIAVDKNPSKTAAVVQNMNNTTQQQQPSMTYSVKHGDMRVLQDSFTSTPSIPAIPSLCAGMESSSRNDIVASLPSLRLVHSSASCPAIPQSAPPGTPPPIPSRDKKFVVMKTDESPMLEPGPQSRPLSEPVPSSPKLHARPLSEQASSSNAMS